MVIDGILKLELLEMASTGEIASFGRDVYEAYWAAVQSQTGFKNPRPGSGVLIGGDISKPEMRTIAKKLTALGFKLYCSSPIVEEHLNNPPYQTCKRIFFPTKDKRKLREVFDEYEIQIVFNLAKSRAESATDEDYVARRSVTSYQFSSMNSGLMLRIKERCRFWPSFAEQCAMRRPLCRSSC